MSAPVSTSPPAPWVHPYFSSLGWQPVWGPLTHGVGGTGAFCLDHRNLVWQFYSLQAGSHIQTLMGSQSLQHRSREQQPYEGNINKVTIQQFQSPLPIQIPSSQATRGPQPGRCLIQTKGQRSMDGYPEQVRRALVTIKGQTIRKLKQLHAAYGPPHTVFFIGINHCCQRLGGNDTLVKCPFMCKIQGFSSPALPSHCPLTPIQLFSTGFQSYNEPL